MTALALQFAAFFLGGLCRGTLLNRRKPFTAALAYPIPIASAIGGLCNAARAVGLPATGELIADLVIVAATVLALGHAGRRVAVDSLRKPAHGRHARLPRAEHGTHARPQRRQPGRHTQ